MAELLQPGGFVYLQTDVPDLAEEIRLINPDAHFIATADDEETVDKFHEAGVFRTIAPPVHAAPAFAQAIVDALKEAVPVDEPPEEEILAFAWVADFPDGFNFLFPNLHSSNLGAGGNFSRYENAELDELPRRPAPA